MSDASHLPRPLRRPSADDAMNTAADPEDLGTAYGLELSIGAPDKLSPASDDDAHDPLAWMRRWVARHKAS
ncbi:MAG: hypothetical protein HS128_18470 [Ideonella sp.]|nr:hypothetical protein [Ideonella sp.]MCC7456707.1 hypothetical protein [Nitrospira sp.]